MSYLLGLDIGTTSIKAILYDPCSGIIVHKASQPTPVDHLEPNLSQHDPQQLWEAVCVCLKQISVHQPISALAISSFAEAGLPLDAKGAPLYPIIAWYDQRTAPQADWWQNQISIEDLYSITGQRLSPSFGVNKYLWLKQNDPKVIAKMKHWVSASDYILLCLTGEITTDYTQASRTMMFDQTTLTWSQKILKLANIDENHLPRIQASGTIAGGLTKLASAKTGLPENLPCILGGHDHLCAALAAGAFRPGVVIDSMGTSESTLITLGRFLSSKEVVQHGFTSYAHVIPNLYILKAGIHVAGGAIEWLVRLLTDTKDNDMPIPYLELEKEAEEGVGNRIGPLWLPHFIGSGTPEADWNSRAALIGASLEHNRGDLLRGLLESQSFWLKQNLDEIQLLSSEPIDRIILLGGTTRLRLLSILKAAVLDLPVVLPNLTEAAAIGAALLAGLGIGEFKNPEEAFHSIKVENDIIQPNPNLVEWYRPIFEKIYRQLYPSLHGIWLEFQNLDQKK